MSQIRPRTQESSALSILLICIMGIMIIPLPAWLLDLGLAVSFSIAILMLMIALFIDEPLHFSFFPTILLFSLILRLALNIASTKLILGEGQNGTSAAGEIIEGFAMFIIDGDFVIGVIIFLALLIVNFLVISKGATRMAEVGARFALDAMPGKQMAIDSDVASGALSHEDAKKRRDHEQSETTFFGSLDGASKFVKGDAVAGLIITALNLVVGLSIGVFSHSMPVSDALETYSILTIGDGLVSQIPAVFISIATALLLARSSVRTGQGPNISAQLSQYPGAILSVGLALACLAFLPGLPAIPFFLISILLFSLGWTFHRKQHQEDARTQQKDDTKQDVHPSPYEDSLQKAIDIEDIHIRFSPNLVPMILGASVGLEARINNMRKFLAESYGFILPEIRLTDDPSLKDGQYEIRIFDSTQSEALLYPDRLLVLEDINNPAEIEGIEVLEPVYGARAKWISKADEESASMAGMTPIEATEVVATHLLEIIKANFHHLFSLSSLQKRLDYLCTTSPESRAEANRKLIASIIPSEVSENTLLAVCKLLLEEQVSIRNLPLILESCVDAKQHLASTKDIYEHVRTRMSFQFSSSLKDAQNTIQCLQLSQEFCDGLQKHEIKSDTRLAKDTALPPEDLSKLAEKVSGMYKTLNASSLNIISPLRYRRFIFNILKMKGYQAHVISYDEAANMKQVSIVGTL